MTLRVINSNGPAVEFPDAIAATQAGPVGRTVAPDLSSPVMTHETADTHYTSKVPLLRSILLPLLILDEGALTEA